MSVTINTALIAKLSPRDKPYDVRDDKLTGFFIRVNISGKMVYMCEYARGKRVTIGKVGVLTPTQARDMALRILGDAAKGIDPRKEKPKSCIRLNEFIEKYYSPWVKEHRKTGYKTVKSIEFCFFEPFGSLQLTEITPAVVDQWRTKKLRDKRSSETVNRDITSLKAALSKAVLWEFIDQHPLQKLKQLKSDRLVKVRYLSLEEEKNLREALIIRDERIKQERTSANKWREERGYELYPDLTKYLYADHMHPMILISINTGLRQGELFSLKWENINFDRAVLTIDGSDAKSGKTRHIPLNSEALTTLKNWRKQSNSIVYIFSNTNGERFDNVKKAWANILEDAGIENFRWHDMRHHFASRLVMAGVDLNTVRELLGHSDLTMTLRYAHLAPEHKANAVEKLVFNAA